MSEAIDVNEQIPAMDGGKIRVGSAECGDIGGLYYFESDHHASAGDDSPESGIKSYYDDSRLCHDYCDLLPDVLAECDEEISGESEVSAYLLPVPGKMADKDEAFKRTEGLSFLHL